MSRMRRSMRMHIRMFTHMCIYGNSQLRMRMHWGLLIFLLALSFPAGCQSVQLLFDALCKRRLISSLSLPPSWMAAILNWRPSWIGGHLGLAAVLHDRDHFLSLLGSRVYLEVRY